MKKLLLLAIVAIGLTSCTDAEKAKFGGFGEDFKIEMISATTGQVVRTYHSSGKVLSEESSDGYYFMDQETGKLTEIAGGIIIITPEKYTRSITIEQVKL